MHEPGCEDWQEHWPQGHTTVDVSTLAASGTANALRVSVERGPAPWLGIWSDQNGIAGLLIGKSSTDQFPMDEGGVIPYPEGADLFLTKATGGSGIVHFARFRTERDARNWTRANATALRGGGSGFGPFPTATVLSDADPNPTTTRIGANVLAWDGGTWERWKHQAWNADNAPVPGFTPAVNAYASIISDRTGTSFPLRQPDSYKLRSTQNSAISLTTTGVKSTITIVQNGRLLASAFDITTQTNTASTIVIQLRLTRGGVTSILGRIELPTAATVGQSFDGTATARDLSIAATALTSIGDQKGFPLIAGDVLDMFVSVAATTAGAGNFSIGVAEERAAF